MLGNHISWTDVDLPSLSLRLLVTAVGVGVLVLLAAQRSAKTRLDGVFVHVALPIWLVLGTRAPASAVTGPSPSRRRSDR